MTFDKLIRIIIGSSSEDWNTIDCNRPNPSFGYAVDPNDDIHYSVAAYKPDLAITMAWGMPCLKDFKEPWTDRFADKKASSRYVDVFYSGSVVFRDLFVVVDGGRASLPMPKAGTNEVKVLEATFIRTLDELNSSTSRYDDYLKQAGFELVDEPWP